VKPRPRTPCRKTHRGTTAGGRPALLPSKLCGGGASPHTGHAQAIRTKAAMIKKSRQFTQSQYFERESETLAR